MEYNQLKELRKAVAKEAHEKCSQKVEVFSWAERWKENIPIEAIKELVEIFE